MKISNSRPRPLPRACKVGMGGALTNLHHARGDAPLSYRPLHTSRQGQTWDKRAVSVTRKRHQISSSRLYDACFPLLLLSSRTALYLFVSIRSFIYSHSFLGAWPPSLRPFCALYLFYTRSCLHLCCLPCCFLTLAFTPSFSFL